MKKSDKDEFLTRFATLLDEYGVQIRFVCSDSSDTSGLHNDRIIIETKEDNQILLDTFDSWRLSVNIVNEFINSTKS